MVEEQTARLGETEEAIRSKVDELLAGMTAAEKAGRLTQYFYFRLPAGAEIENPALRTGRGPISHSWSRRRSGRGEAGSLLFLTDPAEINRLQRLTIEGNRLGIPAMFGYDVIHGLRTILPVPIALAASWDPETIEQGQTVAAREARAVGIPWAFAPMVDIARDPRWGRIIEGAGEDPYLGAAVAAPRFAAFRASGIGAPERIIAGVKHFAGYGAALGGRDYDEVEPLRLRTLERLLPAVPGRDRCGRRQRDDGVHGPQRGTGQRQPMAVQSTCCDRPSASTASWSATPMPYATW